LIVLFSDITGVTNTAKSECDGRKIDGHFTAEILSYQYCVCERVHQRKLDLPKHLKLHLN
jgi:hypothetical protein